MIIKDVRLTRKNNKTTLSAKCRVRKIGWDTVYFTIDSDKESYLKNDASPFAAALLLPSMKLGQDLIIHGSISAQLFDGMHKVMDSVLENWGGGLKRISIHADTVVADTCKPTKTATFFTGGVDSFYTYLKYKHDPVKENRVDSFILAHGFDIHPDDDKLWEKSLAGVQAIADAEHIELVTVKTNLHKLTEQLFSWGDYGHGPSMAAVGLLFRENFRKYYIPSSYTFERQLEYSAQLIGLGSSSIVDVLWSTEHTEFIHDGAEAGRLQKVLWQVSKSPTALKYLRVCYENENSSYNCGDCEKCLRTMLNLYIAGVLDKAETFPHHIDTDKLAAAANSPEHGITFQTENLAELEKRNIGPEYQEALKMSIEKGKLIQTSKFQKLKHNAYTQTMQTLGYIDYAYGKSKAHELRILLFGKRFYQ